MRGSQQEFVAEHYASRAQAYVTSRTHSTGEDLDELEAFLRGQSTARVLDLGCGGGHVSYRAAQHVRHVVACDVTESMLAVVSEQATQRGLPNISTRKAAAEQLPFADGEFDVVLCRFSAHHWLDLTAGLREARRVLKPSGRAMFIDVIAPAEAILDTHLQACELLRDLSHVRDYSRAEWHAALSRSGFALTGTTTRKLRMEFALWIARTATPESHAESIRRLQEQSPELVRRYFAVGADGSFNLDTATMSIVPAGSEIA